MEDNYYIKTLLEKIESADPKSFSQFAHEHPICFQEKKGNWLFPMMFDFYVNKIHNEYIISLLKELGLYLHNKCKNYEMSEITMIDRSLCIDDSFVDNYVLKVQNAQNDKPKFKDLNSPWRTRGISLALYEIPTFVLNSIIFEFKDTEHPYILADIAGMYMYGQKFEEGLNYLYRSINQLAMFPNRYWNSDYGLAGAANTFRLLLLMCPKNHMELYRKIYSYDYLYLTKLACTTNDEIFQQEAYVNRASIAMDSMARYIIPININPDLLYISDMYYAHYCNELATQISISSGWKYNMKSLTYYQHASIKPNDTGGYVDIEEKTYNEFLILSNNDIQLKRKFTVPNTLLKKFGKRLNKISNNLFTDTTVKQREKIMVDLYDILCKYTHASIVVSTFNEIEDKNERKVVKLILSYNLYLIKLILLDCLKFFNNDDKEYIDEKTIGLSLFLSIIKLVNLIQANNIKFDKIKQFFYYDTINSEFYTYYKEGLEKIKKEISESIVEFKGKENKINQIFEEFMKF